MTTPTRHVLPLALARATRAGALGVAVLAAAGAGCAATAEGAVVTTPPPVEPVGPSAPVLGVFAGESMTFEVTVGGLLAGEGAFSVGDVTEVDGRRLIAVRSRLATAGAAALLKRVEDDATTTLDAGTGHPVQLDTDVTFGDKRYQASAAFAGGKVAVRWHKVGEDVERKVGFDFGDAIAHDSHSAMAALRMWRAPAGTRQTVWVVGGRRLWRSDLTLVGTETLTTRVGNRAAVRLDGVAYRAKPDLSLEPGRKPRTFTVWLSDDADRVPLRVSAGTELGDVVIELTDYQRP
ncbi:MAG: DUF3108 domain-containing protein [Kofleriaceae bacterium]|nr:DUF3108 domain-containing protein [Kofleriaceae bacterium]MBP6836269.1 DUF3108 domain-containing protein [Kofleriaceae bacterium]MBP9206040.1 DUF3108 domain-containing protein [Kofleriaceae bacterium]